MCVFVFAGTYGAEGVMYLVERAGERFKCLPMLADRLLFFKLVQVCWCARSLCCMVAVRNHDGACAASGCSDCAGIGCYDDDFYLCCLCRKRPSSNLSSLSCAVRSGTSICARLHPLVHTSIGTHTCRNKDTCT